MLTTNSNVPTNSKIKSQGFLTKINIHDRPVSEIKFNYDGDLLFSASKNSEIYLLRTEGNIIGSYEGHGGAITAIDVSKDSRDLISGSADKNFILWDVETGAEKNRKNLNTMIRSVAFYPRSENILIATDDSFGNKNNLILLDKKSNEITHQIEIPSAPTKAAIHLSENFVVYGDVEGFLTKIDIRTNNVIEKIQAHTSRITNLKNSFCNTFFITSSADSQAKIFDYDFNELRCFVSEDPINSAAIFRTNDKIILAGGIQARDVTTTRSKTNFKSNIFDIMTSTNIGSYTTHFGTINTVDIHPDGKLYASGGEEGFVCVVEFGQDFFDAAAQVE